MAAQHVRSEESRDGQRAGGQAGGSGDARGRGRAHRCLYIAAPRPSRANPAGGVRDVRASRLVADDIVQRRPYRRHHGGHLCLSEAAGHRRAAVHGPRHARAVRAGLPDRPRGAGRRRRGCAHRQRRRLHADARHLPRHPDLEPRTQRPARRWHRRHALAQPAGRWWLQVQPTLGRSGRRRYHASHPGRVQRTARLGARGRATHPLAAGTGERRSVRLHGHLCGRPTRGGGHGRHRGFRPPHRGRPPRWRQRRLVGRHRRALPAGPDRHQHGGGSRPSGS